MTDNTPQSADSELQQLRELLFGEQALQTEDRLGAVETAINSLRRETRQLRHALEVEAMARIDADKEQGVAIEHQSVVIEEQLDSSLIDLTDHLIAQLQHEQAQRAAQLEQLSTALDGYQASQDAMQEALIGQLQTERTAQQEQFAKLKAAVEAQVTSQSSADGDFASTLEQFRQQHLSKRDSNGSAPEVASVVLEDVSAD